MDPRIRPRLKVFKALSEPPTRIVLLKSQEPPANLPLSGLKRILRTSPDQTLFFFSDLKQAERFLTKNSANYFLSYLPQQDYSSTQGNFNPPQIMNRNFGEQSNRRHERNFKSEAVNKFMENEFFDNPFAGTDLNRSTSSQSTNPSPYIGQSSRESDQRKKPRKKPVSERQSEYFVINEKAIAQQTDQRTTVMIKNIPNKYNQKMLLEIIDKHFAGSYDFFYLPIDFKNKCNVGYAFINFLDFRVIPEFCRRLGNRKWGRFNSEKICALAYARLQGKNELIQHFQSSSVMNQQDHNFKPLILPSTHK